MNSFKKSGNDNKHLPLQKCINGEEVRNLSDLELLAVILGTGTKSCDVMDLSGKLLGKFKGLFGLSSSGIREIAAIEGVGLKKSIRIHSSFEIGRRVITDRNSSDKIDSPEAVWNLLLPELAGLCREEFRVLILNNKNRLLKKVVVSVGTISEAIVHPREVFRDAIREGGSSVIVSHNHPSGITTPSKEDVATSERLKKAGAIIGIPMLDHVIITDSAYLSMKEEGYI